MSKLRTAIIQLIVGIGLLFTLELAARVFDEGQPSTSMDMNLTPYTMFSMPPGDNGGYVWQNIFTNQKIPSTLSFNNFGFAEAFDYSMFPDEVYLSKFGKKPNEKLVVITGASVVHGVGATALEATIPKQLEKYLHINAGDTTYRVLNMAMARWIAYQQFIGLSLFAKPLNPDWVVVFDGHNDGGLACGYGTGPGNPLGWPKMLYYSYGQKLDRGLIENIAEHSALLRLLLGRGVNSSNGNSSSTSFLSYREQYAGQPYEIALRDLKFEVMEEQANFYIRSQRNVAELFHDSNILFTIQPVAYDNALGSAYRRSAAPSSTRKDNLQLRRETQDYMEKNRYKPCSPALSSQTLAYMLNKAQLELPGLTDELDERSKNRRVVFTNAEWAMPIEIEKRQKYFVDNAHMSDIGQEIIGQFLANHILATDRGEKYGVKEFLKENSQR